METTVSFKLEKRHFDDMVAHAKEGLPNEACGIVAGNLRNNKIAKFYRTRNAENSAVRYMIDAREQLEIMQEMEEKGWDLLGIFHSHTHSPAYPSHTDVHLAYYPDAIYFIVSLMNEEPVMRAFRIVDGKITEVALLVKG